MFYPDQPCQLPCGRKPECPEKIHDFRQTGDWLFSHKTFGCLLALAAGFFAAFFGVPFFASAFLVATLLADFFVLGSAGSFLFLEDFKVFFGVGCAGIFGRFGYRFLRLPGLWLPKVFGDCFLGRFLGGSLRSVAELEASQASITGFELSISTPTGWY